MEPNHSEPQAQSVALGTNLTLTQSGFKFIPPGTPHQDKETESRADPAPSVQKVTTEDQGAQLQRSMRLGSYGDMPNNTLLRRPAATQAASRIDELGEQASDLSDDSFGGGSVRQGTSSMKVKRSPQHRDAQRPTLVDDPIYYRPAARNFPLPYFQQRKIQEICRYDTGVSIWNGGKNKYVCRYGHGNASKEHRCPWAIRLTNEFGTGNWVVCEERSSFFHNHVLQTGSQELPKIGREVGAFARESPPFHSPVPIKPSQQRHHDLPNLPQSTESAPFSLSAIEARHGEASTAESFAQSARVDSASVIVSSSSRKRTLSTADRDTRSNFHPVPSVKVEEDVKPSVVLDLTGDDTDDDALQGLQDPRSASSPTAALQSFLVNLAPSFRFRLLGSSDALGLDFLAPMLLSIGYETPEMIQDLELEDLEGLLRALRRAHEKEGKGKARGLGEHTWERIGDRLKKALRLR